MLTCLAVPSDKRDLLGRALGAAWRGGEASVGDLELPGRGAREITLVQAAGVTARRPAVWPDVLVEWRDLWEEPLFPDDAMPVLGELVSQAGADAVALHTAPGWKSASVAWYDQGVLVAYEHVGGSSVGWSPEGGLGRPFDGSTASLVALGGKKLAGAVGAHESADVMDRISGTNRAVGETLIARAFLRLSGVDPPEPHDLLAAIARIPVTRLRVP